MIGVLLAFFVSAVPTPPLEEIQFNRDVRAILAENCFYCHGPDAGQRKADLRLDSREAATQSAIVPGEPDKSELVRRILTEDPDVQMPPPESNKKLTDEEKKILQRWIAGGASYEGHWAFQTLRRPEVPAVSDHGIRNPIDQFVRFQLNRMGLAANREADKTTLLRRVTLDLTGLPPTIDEIDSFLNDSSPSAYESVVDRLLNSPQYGERMAIQWLDYARYADSNGFQTDSSRQMWHWRNWVIQAYNRNLPFDQFTIEQLAGDLLPSPSKEQLIATGFHRNNRLNGEGGRIVEEWFAETVIDRVETTGQTWLGLTIGCCRCHDHKYDPITQKEFFQFYAYFNSVNESGVLDADGGSGRSGNSKPLLKLPTEEQLEKRNELLALLEQAESKAKEAEKQLSQEQALWESEAVKRLQEKDSGWRPLEWTTVKSSGKATLTRLEDGSWLASGNNAENDTYTLDGTLPEGRFSGVLLEVLPDKSLPNESLGRAFNGNFVLSSVVAEIQIDGASEPNKITFAKAVANYEQQGYEVSSVLAKKGKGWAVDGNDPAKRLARKAMFLLDQPMEIPAGATLRLRLIHRSVPQHNIGRFRISATSVIPQAIELEGQSFPESIRKTLEIVSSERTKEQTKELENYFREKGDHSWNRAKVELANLRKKLTELEDSFSNTMVMEELAEPRTAYVLKRGEYDKIGERVERSVPGILPPLPRDVPNNRLGLARWIVSPENPLTARVWVNRQWERFFGIGLVKSIDNFGTQADSPSHPELLDWLSTEFVQSGWDMKSLQKLIVTSATYRQSSQADPQSFRSDPDNRLLARGPRFRLPAETVRDQALAIGGLLVHKTGGPSVRPYMPQGVWDETSKYGDLRGYQHDKGDGLYRRSIYTIWKRTAAPPTMLMFDSPSREFCAVKRSRTNTPLQALALMNEVTYVEAARHLALNMIQQGGETIDEKLRWGFRRTTGRLPSEEEVAVLKKGFLMNRDRFQRESQSIDPLLSVGETVHPQKCDPLDLAAYTMTANVLLNLDEVVTKE